MTHENLTWLTGVPPRDGRIMVEISDGVDKWLYAGEAKQGLLYVGKVNLRSKTVVAFAYLDDAPVTPTESPAGSGWLSDPVLAPDAPTK